MRTTKIMTLNVNPAQTALGSLYPELNEKYLRRESSNGTSRKLSGFWGFLQTLVRTGSLWQALNNQ